MQHLDKRDIYERYYNLKFKVMPNEEPEGPKLPPHKSASIGDNENKATQFIKADGDKHTEIKGVIGVIAAAIILFSYLVYYFYYYNNGVKLNELYFISSGIGISIFTGLLFTFFENLYIRTILLFTSVFYLMLEMIYIIMWIVLGEPYAYLKTSLIIGLIIGIIYFIYDKLNNKPRTGN